MAGRSNGKTDVAEVVRALESQMAGGHVRAGDFLPSIRSVSSDLGCAPLTVHRAMRQLVRRGMVVAVSRRGYRIADGARRPPSGRMVVFLENSENYEEFLGHIYKAQLRSLQREAMRRNWTFVLLPYQRQSVASIGDQLHKIGATGIILQDIGHRFPAGLTREICDLGLPIVNLNTPDSESCLMDHVLRDELHGAALAAEYLLRRGHRRIGWFGRLGISVESRRRFSGATEILLREGIEIDAPGICSLDETTAEAAARPYLLRKNRPPAVLALWDTTAIALARAALELGLKLGRGLDIAGWCLEENFETDYASLCPELAQNCAAVVWNMADVARSVFNRLEDRLEEPDLPPARILLPMKLWAPATVRGRAG